MTQSNSCRYPQSAATASACLRRPLGPQPHAPRHATAACQKCVPTRPSQLVTLRTRHRRRRVLLLLLIVTASYAHRRLGPPLLVSDPCYSHACLIGVCTQVAPLPCYYSASVRTSSRAAQPTLARSASSCMYQCYVWKRAYAIPTGPRESSPRTSMCCMRTSCMCMHMQLLILDGLHACYRKLPRSSLCSAAHLHRS